MRKLFRTLVSEKRPFMGTFVQIPSREIVEIIGYSGFDYVIIDCEHGYIDCQCAADLIRTCDAVGLAALVRPKDAEEDAIKKALDAGASGLIIPNIRSVQQAKQVVAWTKFPPQGSRGSCPYVRANRFGLGGSGYFEQANRDIFVQLCLESPKTVEQMEDFFQIDGVDSIGLGMVDIAVKLGVPGQTDHPYLQQARRRAVELTKKYGKVFSCFATSYEQALRWRESGADCVTFLADTTIISQHFAELHETIARANGMI